MISILLSCLNGEHDLVATLESILAQSYRDWEVIGINDGSTDQTGKILEEYQRRFPSQFRIYHNASKIGLTRSLIKAAQHAKGELLARIDCGDRFYPDKLEKQMAFLESHKDYGLVGCNYINIFSASGKRFKSQLPLKDAEIRHALLKKNPFAHSCILMKTSVYNSSGGYNSSVIYCQDYDLWFRMLKITKAANLPHYLCERTVIRESISYSKQRAQMLQSLKIQWKYLHKWNPWHYAYLLEPLSLVVIPEFIKKFLRRTL